MRRLAALAGLALVLSGCGATGVGGISGVWVDAPHGKVWCVATGAGSLDCDWRGYHDGGAK